MSWTKREAVTDLVILGDGEGCVKKVGGLLAGIVPDSGYPDKVNYKIVKQDGEEITLSGSASLSRQLNERDIGHFIKAEFTGWGKSPNGKFKAIEVFVYDGEPTEVMRAWPRFKEFQGSNGKPPVAQKAAPKPAGGVNTDWPGELGDDDAFPGALEDEEDDLPF